MKLSRSVAMLLALLLCWGQYSYASSGGVMMADAGAAEMTLMMSMDCGESCDQVAEPCQDMQCPTEHRCSGGSAFMVSLQTASIVQGSLSVPTPQPDHYRYCSITAIDHPPRVTV